MADVTKPRPSWGPAKLENRGTRYPLPNMQPVILETLKAPYNQDRVISVADRKKTNGATNGIDNSCFLKERM